MARALSRRCTPCGIQYPVALPPLCPVCGGKTWEMFKTGPDPDWRERVEASLGEGAGVDPPTIAYAVQHPPGVDLPLHILEGRLWLSHGGLIEAGYSYLEAGSVVFVGNRFYELIGHSDRHGMWWVEEITTDGAFDDATPEQIINGGGDV